MKKLLLIIVILSIVFSFVTPALAADDPTAAPVWEDLGPGQIRANAVNDFVNVEGMASTSNPTTGAITKVLVDPGNSNIIYAGAVNGGIWKTTDNGTNWSPLTDRLSSLSIGAMNFDTSDTTNQTIIAGAGRQSAFRFESGPLTGIQYSTNGGTTWVEKRGTAADIYGKDITGVAARGTIMIATVRNIYDPIGTVGLYRSTDSGDNFVNLSIGSGLPNGNIQNLAADPTNPSRFYLSVVNGVYAETGIYRSDDTGATWMKVLVGREELTGLSTTNSNGRILLSVGANGVLVAQVQQGGKPGEEKTITPILQILRTADGGSNWTNLGNPSNPKTPDPGFTGLFPSGQTSVHGAVLADPNDPYVVYVAGDTQYTITDSSIGANQWSCPIFRGVYDPVTKLTTWTYITNNNTLSGSAPHADARTFAIDANGRLLFGGDGGLCAYLYPATLKTYDWFPIMNNLRITEMTQSCWNSITHTVSAAAQDVGAYYKFPGQKGSYDWSSTRGGDGGPGPVNVKTIADTSVVYTSSQYLGGFRRFKVGKAGDAATAATTLTRVRPYIGDKVYIDGESAYMSFLSLVALNRTDPSKMAIGGKQLFIGTDDPNQEIVSPTSWWQFPVTSILTLGSGDSITSLAYGTNAVGNNALLAGTYGGYLCYTTNADTKSMDILSGYTTASGKYVYKAIFDERDGSRFYVADGANIWRSIDSGANFTSIKTDTIPANFINYQGLAFAANNGVNALFVGGVSNIRDGSGIYVTRFTNTVGAETTPTWSSFGGSMANAPVYGMSYDTTDDVLLVNLFGRGAWVVYDLTTYFPEATTLIFGKADNNSAPAFTLTDGKLVGGVTTFVRGLTKTGSGTLTLNGANTYTGATTINASGGTLRVNNPSALGTGAGGVTNNATLDIGSTKLNIGAGNYTQGAGATLQAAVNGTSSGTITTTGNCTVNTGDNLALDVTNYIQNNATYTIIDGAGAGGINAPVITVNGNNHATFSATTTGKQLILTASRAANGYPEDASNSNASAAGTVLEAVGNAGATGDMATVLNALDNLSNSQTSAALDTLVPEVDAGVIDTSMTTLNNFVGVAIDRVENVLTIAKAADLATTGVSAGEASKISGVWGKGYGSYLTQGARRGVAGYDAWNAGTALGIDRLFYDCVTLGISGGWAYGNVDSDDTGNANTNINSAQTTIYGGYSDQNLPYFIDAAGSFAYNWYNGKRDINVGPTINRTAKGKYGGQQYGAYLGGGYKFDLVKNIDFTPLLSLQYNHLSLNSYTETGAGALDLTYNRQGYDQLQSGLGARIASPTKCKWGTFTPEVHGKWFYDFIGDDMAVTSNFNGGGGNFGSNGCKPALNSFNVGGQLIFDFKNDVSIIGNCDTEMKNQFFGIYGSLTLRYDF